MESPLPSQILNIRKNRALYASNEQVTKQGIVLPLLAQLGWDWTNISEVFPEYTAGSGRVDYCLRQGDQSLAFVEVKRAGEELDGHQQQLLRYAFEQGVPLAVLTDGIRWWLYLPTETGTWEQRRFFTIDIVEQAPEDVEANLSKFLSKAQIANGEAFRAARELHASRAKELAVRHAIPAAWQELCEQPHPRIIELLSEKVEGRCGHKADPDLLEEFVVSFTASAASEVRPRPVRTSLPAERRKDAVNVEHQQPWTFHKPVAFTFLGRRTGVARFKDILTGLASQLQAGHPTDFFERVSQLQSSRGRQYFTREPDQLQEAREVGSSGVWVETCFSANAVRDRCLELLAAFGYSTDTLQVELLPPS